MKSKVIIRGIWIVVVLLIVFSMFAFLLAPLFSGPAYF